MVYSLTWLPEALLRAGLKVAPVDGWETRGRGDVGQTLGVICHYTQGQRVGNMPTLGTLLHGREDLPGPLAQLGLGRDGTFYVIAAGRCNHAGSGSWQQFAHGNSNFIGIEAENTGFSDDPWPAVQMDAYRRGVAAILGHVGREPAFCAGHREYALPRGRKSDPNFDMDEFRAAVDAIMRGGIAMPALIPREAPPGPDGTARPTLRRLRDGETPSDAVLAATRALQTKLGRTADGLFGAKTEAALRAFQRSHGLVPDGITGPKTWAALDAV